MKRTQLLSVALAVAGARATATKDAISGLQNAINEADRIAVLKDDSDFVFDFQNPALKSTTGAGGRTVSSNVANFPALFGSGIAMTIGFMEPCSLNSPHTHPRATEILLLMNGTIESGFLAENNARFVMNTITPLEAAVFPLGSIHFQANLGCEPAMFVAALSDEDPGTLQIAQRFFALPGEVVGAALGGIGVEQVAELAKFIPDNLIQATESCFTKCKLPPPAKGAQPTKQQQAPNPAPTTPAGSEVPSNPNKGTFEDKGTPVNWFGQGNEPGSAAGHGTHHESSSDYPADSSSSSSSSSGGGNNKDLNPSDLKHNIAAVEDNDKDDDGALEKAEKGAKGWFAGLPHDGTKIALVSLAAVNLVAIILGVVLCALHKSQRRKRQMNGGLESMSTASAAAVTSHGRGGPRPLLTASRGGKYAAAQYELPMDDAASVETVVPRQYDDPYDKPVSRAHSPLPPAHNQPYRD